MKGKRTERLIRIASRMLTNPSRPISLTETAAAFNVSKTLISDDVEIISNAIAEEGIGIRIEDNILIEDNGCRVLSKDIIKTVEDIEDFMK